MVRWKSPWFFCPKLSLSSSALKRWLTQDDDP
jgi:hypothetical protein